MKSLVVLCLGLATAVAQSATIAVIDSGVDYSHSQLQSQMWKSSTGSTGRNFVEDTLAIFDPSLISTFSPDLKKYYEITSKSFLFLATDEEQAWAIEKQKEKGFNEEANRYGTYVHGTHVAGIAMKGTSHQIMDIKLLKTPVKAILDNKMKSKYQDPEDPAEVLNSILTGFTFSNALKMSFVGTFLNDNNVEIANGSYGTGIFEAAPLAARAFEIAYARSPSDKELFDTTLTFLKMTIEAGSSFVNTAPNTLFVFAAGNDNLSNDHIGASPANIKADNTITVAATYKSLFLAPFSNYGVKMVEVAAPGMLIKSSIPGNDYLSVSGTSQAAPFVANVAGKVKDANPSLKPLEIKQILMGTVDKKSFLKDKVASGGMVNAQRAVFAATLSLTVSVEEAIARSNESVKPARAMKALTRPVQQVPFIVTPIPLPSEFDI
jgi:subtilisin family serine protease